MVHLLFDPIIIMLATLLNLYAITGHCTSSGLSFLNASTKYSRATRQAIMQAVNSRLHFLENSIGLCKSLDWYVGFSDGLASIVLLNDYCFVAC